jgi:hypothetical protein
MSYLVPGKAFHSQPGADGSHGLEEFLQTHVVYMDYDMRAK